MALSGTWAYTVTRDLIIRQAMINVGALGEAEVATAQEVSDCADKLNMIVKQWMGSQDFAPGLKMWERQRGDLFLSNSKGIYQLGSQGDQWAAGVTAIPGANYGQQQLTAQTNSGSAVLTFGVGNVGNFTANDFVVVQLATGDIFTSTVLSINSGGGTVTLNNNLTANASSNAYVWNYTTKGQRPLAIRTCILRDSTSNDTPLNVMTLEDYEFLPSKQQPGFLSDPQAFYYESQFASGTSNTAGGMLYLDVYGAQDVTKHLHIVYMRPVMDFNNPNDNPEYPQQWYRALCWGLSKDICSMFDAEWTEDMQANYLESVAMAREADAETSSFYFQVQTDDAP
jgi:hypothetical protein